MAYDFDKINEININAIVDYYNIKQYGTLIHCINPSHEDKKPSMLVGDLANKLICRSCNCGKTYGVLDTIMLFEGCDLNQASKKAIEIINGVEQDYIITNLEKKEKKSYNAPTGNKIPSKKEEDKKEELRKQYKSSYEWSFGEKGKKFLNQRQKDVEEYLKTRGLKNISSIKKALAENKIYYSLDKYKNVTFYFTKQNLGINRRFIEVENRYRNCVVGYHEGKPFTPICADKNKKYWFVVEGIFDALSLVDEGHNVICLNSTKNISYFLEYLKSNKENLIKSNVHLFIELDYDDEGDKASNLILEGIDKLNFPKDFAELSSLINRYISLEWNKGAETSAKDLNDIKVELMNKNSNEKLLDFYCGDYFGEGN